MRGHAFLLTMLVLGALAHVVAGQSASATRRAVERTDIHRGCGTYAAAFLATRVGGLHVGYSPLDRTVDPDGDGVSSILDLKRAVVALGLTVEAYHSPDKELPTRPAILRLASSENRQPPHFVYVEPGAGDSYSVFYAPVGVISWPSEDLVKLWDGNFVALETSTAPSTAITSLLAAFLIVIVLLAARRGMWR